MDDATQQSRMLTLVFTDLADSTALKTARGDDAVDALLTRHREHVQRLAAECVGRVIDWAGDGCFLTFETSSAAVMFSLRLQQVHSDESDLPGVRIGVHLGDVTERTGPDATPQVKGLAVDIAARVSGLAKPGQVLMSSAIYNSARQRLGVDAIGQPILWQLHGTYDLKGFDHPLEIGEAGFEGSSPLEAPIASEKAQPAAGATGASSGASGARPRGTVRAWFVSAAVVLLIVAALAYTVGLKVDAPTKNLAPGGDSAAAAPITSLAVLPLDNLMDDPEQEYFTDGMTEAITAELGKIKALKVISRTSVMRYKDTELSMLEIAAELGVDGLIEGSVLRDGDDVRITVQLIDGRSDAHLWSDSYTETMTSVLKLQSDVALAIAEEIQVTITPDERERVSSTQEIVPEAYNAYLLGRHYAAQSVTQEGFARALGFFEDATELDPTFADAWTGIGRTHSSIAGWAGGSPQRHYAAARTALRTALELDPNSGRAHAELGLIALASDWDWAASDRLTRRALELAPGDVDVHFTRADFLQYAGRFKEVELELAAVAELSPNTTNSQAGGFLIGTRQYAVAIETLESVLRADPNHEKAANALVQAYRNKGDHVRALEAADRYMEITRGSLAARTSKMRALAAAGHETEARALIQEITTEPGLEFDAADVAEALVMLGDLDAAFDWYDRVASARGFDILAIRNAAAGVRLFKSEHTDRLGQDPRYWAIVERVGFPPLSPEHPGYADEQAWRARKVAEAEASAPIEKIAVLPFRNIMRDSEQEYFVDGMTEALISALDRIRSLEVRGWTAVSRFKDTTKSPEEIARELEVDAIVEGSVLREDDQVRITARLIHVASGISRYDGTLNSTVTSVLKLHSEMALAIAEEISANLTPREEAIVAEVEDVNAEAYEQVLMGRFAANTLSPAGYAEAEERARRAIELAPNYADAYALLRNAIGGPVGWGWVSHREVIDELREISARGLELDPNNSGLIASEGWTIMIFDRDWAEAERYFARAIDADPKHAGGFQGRSWLHAVEGDYEAALDSAMQAVELDPYNPTTLDFLEDVYTNAGRYEEAIEWGIRALRVDPDNVGNLLNIMQRYAEVGREEDVRRIWERLTSLGDELAEMCAQYYAISLAMLGFEAEARSVMEAAVADPDIYVDPGSRMWYHAALGEEDQVFEWLERTYEERSIILLTINTRWTRVLDPYRDDPRFQAVVERVNFPEPAAP